MTMAAGERALRLRMRPDLDFRPLGHGASQFWRIKDPVAQRHFELPAEEFFVLEQLDGQTSLESIRASCQRQFAPRRVTAGRLMSLLVRLHSLGLVVSDSPHQARELLRRGAERRRQSLVWGWTRILGLRWRGIDPEPLLNRLEPWCGWIFTRGAAVAAMLTMLAALALLAVHSADVRLRLPEFQAFFSLRNAGWLALSVVGAKVLHELGHALACRHFGGECHEMGIVLLVFLPCLYCNVSDAWMFSSRWRRAVVDAAGMYVELMLAAVCTFVWWSSAPGWLNSISFNLMVVCSLSTLLFNGNPLLRYDGYYLLSDLAEVPNLQQRADAVLRQAWEWCFLAETQSRSLVGETSPVLLGLYGASALVYRWSVSLGVVWFCYQALKPYRLEALASGVAGVVAAALLVTPLRQAAEWLRTPLAGGQLLWPRIRLAAGLVALAGGAFWLLPLPHRIHVPAVVEPAGARRIYISVPGTLSAGVQMGDRVQTGQPLATLTDPEMDLEIARLRGERDQQRLKLANLKRQQLEAPQAGFEIPTAAATLADLEKRLEQRLAEQQRLTPLAPADGTVLPGRSQTPKVGRGELRTWSGQPLDPVNRGCFLQTGALLCLIGDPQRFEAVLFVDEDQVEFVRPGQKVRLLLGQVPDTEFTGTIVELAEIDLGEVPPELIERGQLPTRADGAGKRRALGTYYQARAAVDASSQPLVAGATGEAKIFADWRPLGPRLLRLLTGTFRFDL
jgi:putative peptide zinc metalloprotease protein